MVDGLEILKSEVESNLKKMNEAAGSKQAVTDMTIALEDYGIDKQTEIINEFYNTDGTPEELKVITLILQSEQQ